MSTQGLSMVAFPLGGTGTAKHAIARPDVVAMLRRRPWLLSLLIDIAAISVAVLDVWLVIPEEAPTYSIVLSGVACAALLGRRWLPFATVLATIPGFMTGWSQLAAMIALGFLAHRKGMHWQVWVGALLVIASRFVIWPPADMLALAWGEHVKNLLYAPIVAGMPIAIGLLVLARKDLSRRLVELDASRDRERRLHTRAVRADERARLAREMHDVVSHEVTLIAMQANTLEVAHTPEETRRAAATIRQLSCRTLEELRSLVGVLRSSSAEELPCPGIDELGGLVRETDVPVRLKVEQLPEVIPQQVSAAVYRTVQEALTNVHKHAPGAAATIRVHCDDDTLRIEVRNDRPTRRSQPLPSGGHGLAGLAERALLLDGTFHARSTDDGGFEVRADYPV
ncbi:MAG: sensor histidine kinase [Actinophytocola sp.]|nr:sensor histidine kinase [Actinophytocola sp.]